MDEKWSFLLIINRDNRDKHYWNLVEMEKSIPPPLQSSISMESLQENGKHVKSCNMCSKGQRDAYSSMYEWGNNPL